MRVAYPDLHCPFSAVLEKENLPNADKIADAPKKLAAYSTQNRRGWGAGRSGGGVSGGGFRGLMSLVGFLLGGDWCRGVMGGGLASEEPGRCGWGWCFVWRVLGLVRGGSLRLGGLPLSFLRADGKRLGHPHPAVTPGADSPSAASTSE